MTDLQLKQLQKNFKSYPKIKLVYFFGSRTVNQYGPLSDYDFAFYIDEKNKFKLFDYQLKLFGDLSRILKTDKIDIVILNLTDAPELKYNIIKDGHLIYEQEPFAVLIEPRILDEYFDFKKILRRFSLTKTI